MVTESRKPHLRRQKTSIREERPKILIVCEGEKTEPNYFRAFRIADVEVQGLGKNTRGVVEEAIDLRNKNKGRYSAVWAVFDRDSFPAQDIAVAVDLAAKHGIHIAFSNEAFEIWYILHYEFRNTGLSRTEYKAILTKHLQRKYQKNDLALYDTLKEKQSTALAHAEKLAALYAASDKLPDRNPFTTVHELVKQLNMLKTSQTAG